MDKYKFGEYIYLKRKEKGLTQDELGRKLHLTNKAVSKWETGETLPEVSMLTDLATILGITVDELLTQTKPEVKYEKPKKTPIIILSVLCGLLVILFITYFIISTKPKYIEINSENYTSYYNISTIGSSLNGTSLKIKVNIDDFEVIDPELELNFTITYYYTRNSRAGEITYTDRSIKYDGITHDYYLDLTPAYELNDITFVGYDISYTLINVKGKIQK